MTHIEVTQAGSEFTYTVFNDEPATSSLYVNAFHLTIGGAPFSVTSTPEGWDYFTDNSTYIDWYNTELELPYPHDVAPDSSLGGFTILSAVATSELLPFGFFRLCSG
jgi:hypothetical protein